MTLHPEMMSLMIRKYSSEWPFNQFLDHDGRSSVDISGGSQNKNGIKTGVGVHLGASNHREDFYQIFMRMCNLTRSAVI